MKEPAGEWPIIEGCGEALGMCSGLGNDSGFGEFADRCATPGEADWATPDIDGGEARLNDVAGEEPKFC